MLLPGREGPEERHGGNAEQPEQSPPPAHGRLLTSLWGARHLQPPLSTAPPTVPSFARVVRVREGPREYLADAHLLRQLPGAGGLALLLLGPLVGSAHGRGASRVVVRFVLAPVLPAEHA